MNFKEAGFRAFYHNLVALKANDVLKPLLKGYPDAESASYVLLYGYIDPAKGLMLEVLAGAKKGTKYFHFFDPNNKKRSTIAAGKVADLDIFYFEDEDGQLHTRYAEKLEKLKPYDVSEDMEKSRSFAFLDDSRKQTCPDDIRVCFLKEGLKSEDCWVRLTGLGEHQLIGTLLKNPRQDFGCTKGDTITFGVRELEDHTYICVARFEDDELSPEDLEDGSVLKGAISDFHRKQEDETFGYILAVLRNSKVIVPCDVVLSDEAQKILEKCEAEGKEISDLSGAEADQLHGGTSFRPVVLENDKHRCISAFSGNDEISDHMDGPARVTMPFLRAMQFALVAGDDIAGIVINPYTQAFFVERELFDQIAEMESFSEEEDDAVIAAENEDAFGDDSMIRLSVGQMGVFNYVLAYNDVPPIKDIRIQNISGNPVSGLSLHIFSDYDFFIPYELALPDIPFGKPIKLEDPNLIITGKTLANLTEAVKAVITVELRLNGESLCGRRGEMTILAYDQWQGFSYMPYLPAFIMPNHPAVSMLLHEAAERLEKWNMSPAIDGYQAGDPNRVRELAAAAYAAIQKKNIVYATSPANLWEVGQRIRTPEMIFDKHLGNCMDMTLLYAACLEAMGLHPVLILRTGHIYAGVWLRQRSGKELDAASVITESWEELTKRVNNGAGELTFVECTSMCSEQNISFEQAEEYARNNLLNEREAFVCAIDVFVSRFMVKPVPSRIMDGGTFRIDIQDKDDSEITAAPDNAGLSIVYTDDFSGTKKITSKKELWESKLLDLSQHNMLLDLPLNASIEPIMSSHIDELEDALADGHAFHLLPVPEWVASISFSRKDKDGKESKPKQWLPEAIKECGVFELTDWPAGEDFDLNEQLRQEFRNHKVYTFCGEKQLERELTALYRAARSSQLENGVSSLFLAIGLLRWFAPETDVPCYAPLILLPIEIVRKSANQGV